MRIGVNTLFLIPGEVGGSETYLLEILRQWKRRQGAHTFVLFTQRDNHAMLDAEFSGEGWDCVLSPFSASNRFARIAREQLELPFRARRARPDVLWSPGYTAPLFAACPQVVTLHDMQYKHFPHDLTWLARLTTHLLVQACALDRRKKILTISEFSKKDILRHTVAKAEQVAVVPEAADEAFCPPRSLAPTSPPYLLCVANSYPHKAVDTLVAAFALLEDHIPHDLIVVGKPRLGEAAVQEALRKVRDPGRVKRPAGLDRAALIGMYQAADLFVFPSQYEGFGLPVLEAMRAGVPVLTTRCGSIPEVGGDAVEYADGGSPEALRDKILALLGESPEQRAARVQRGLARAETFSWAKTAARTLELLVARA